MQIRDSVAVVTGASSGIGRSTALALGRSGASVVLAARRGELLEEVSASIRAGGSRALPFVTDVTKPDDLDALAAAVAMEFGQCDILVNNAGIAGHGPFETANAAQIEAIVRVNLLGVLHGTRAFLPTMLAAGRGHIMNVASLAGRHPVPGGAVYSATKHAVAAFSESLYYEVGERGVRVTSVNPAFVETPGFPQGNRDPRLVMDTERVSRAIVRAIRRDAGPQITIPRWAGALEAIRVVAPGPYRWGMRTMVAPRHHPRYPAAPGGDD